MIESCESKSLKIPRLQQQFFTSPSLAMKKTLIGYTCICVVESERDI